MTETHSCDDPRPTAQIVVLSDLPAGAQPAGAPLVQGNLSLVEGVKVRVDASLGSAEMTVGELFALRRDSVVALEAALDAPIELRLAGKLVALGQLVAVDERFGLRITEIVPQGPAERRG
jgi:flagellar motor switch protein FliN/FliY